MNFYKTALYRQIRDLRGEHLDRLLKPILILCVERALPFDKTDHCKTVLQLLRDPATTREQFCAAAAAAAGGGGVAGGGVAGAAAAYAAAAYAAADRERFLSELFLLVNFGGYEHEFVA